MRKLWVVFVIVVSLALFASTATALSTPFKMHTIGLSATPLKATGHSLGTGLKLPSMGNYFKQLNSQKTAAGNILKLKNLGQSTGFRISSPFGKSGIGLSAGHGITNPLSSKSRGLTSLFAGFPILRK